MSWRMTDLIPSKKDEPSFSDKIKQAKVSVVANEGDTATIKIEVPGEKSDEEKMVKVEGKWIPKNLADNWKTKMDEVRKQLETLTPEKVTAQKEQTLAGLKQVNEVLAQLEKAENAEQFNKTLNPIVAPAAMFLPMLMMQMGGQPMMGGPGSPGGPSLGDSTAADPATVVEVVIAKKLSNAEQDPIIDELMKVADGLTILPVVEGETTIIRVSPIKDVATFAKKIKFGKTTKVDPKTRSITVELNK